MNSKPISFVDIFKLEVKEGVKVNSIEIPIIQRDYAQGRESKEVTRIRSQFLSVIHSALIGTSEPVKLDFVYGNITNGTLIPLDGQQRLTTLFLLHWYLAKKEKVEEVEYAFLNNFTYRTRFSSSHFCKNIMQSVPDFSVPLLSKWIKDQSWYMYSWDYDPTITSRLIMLDDIHSIFKDEVELWSQISREENPPISFYFLPLEDMGLTDSLYIKMNSRGKPLTEFEHFKAEFEVMVKAVSKDLYDEFIKKVDNDWVDMLWKYKGDDNVIDDEFMRYFRFITETTCNIKGIAILENDFDLARNVYSVDNHSAEENLRFLFRSFDCWVGLHSINDYFNNIFSAHVHEEGKVVLYSSNLNLFEECCKKYGISYNRRREFTLNNTILLYAILIYQINKEQITEIDFQERIRIVRNLVFNSSDEIREDRMQSLLLDTQQIILNNDITLKNLSFNEIQKTQEIDKIKWRAENEDLIQVLNKLEDHLLMQGNIAIIGLEESSKFKSRVANFIQLFDGGIRYSSIRKALLSIDDYSQLASWRFLFGNSNASSWRELFTPSKQRRGFEKTKTTLIHLLDSINGDFHLFINSISENFIIENDQMKDWRYYFIKYQAIRQGNSGVYYWYNDGSRVKENQYEFYMMNTSLSLNGKHWNPFLYVLLHDEELKNKLSLDDYAAPLIINKTFQKVKCKNSCWEIYDSNDILINTIQIPQVNGIDTVDRIEIIKDYINKVVN